MIVDQMAFFPPGHELNIKIPDELKSLSRSRDAAPSPYGTGLYRTYNEGEIKLQVAEVLKKVVLKRCVESVDDFLDVMKDSMGRPLNPYQRELIKCLNQR